eukprot:4216483-Lingulodinium_polyedra.AAC.1
MFWLHSCPCHFDLYKYLPDAALGSKMRALWDTCPLRGTRGLCMANGGFLNMLDELSDTTSASFVSALPSTTPVSRRTVLLS